MRFNNELADEETYQVFGKILESLRDSHLFIGRCLVYRCEDQMFSDCTLTFGSLYVRRWGIIALGCVLMISGGSNIRIWALQTWKLRSNF